jgi:lipopolysaccharide transport system ATP-binding protein
MRSLVSGGGDRKGNEETIFWALKEVSFNVKRGEIVGVIGRNGAGKSTLLKLLSRITEPTCGFAEIYGRVGALLEVGTGFHPELTGRENIYLNGAILGMKRAEIASRFDEIVAFAEVEKFIDTPVKHYSSGMYLRLAFAIAAHLEPEILIVDEVLAVGDAEFQKKCLGKMQQISAGEGRTVLFVSHNLAAVRQLCTRGVLLHAGQVAMTGTANEVSDRYVHSMLATRADRFKRDSTGYTDVRAVNEEGRPTSSFTFGEPAFIELDLRVNSGSDVQCGFTIYNQLDVPLLLCASEYGGVRLDHGDHRFRVCLPYEMLRPGSYRIEGAVWDKESVFHQDNFLCSFLVVADRLNEMHGRSSEALFVSREPWAKL